MERHDQLRERRGDRQQRDADERAEQTTSGSWPANGPRYAGSVAPGAASYQIGIVSSDSASAQASTDDDELDDRQREVDRDVEHVPPAALVGELGAQDRDDAAAQRPIRVGDRSVRLADERPPALDPGDEPRALDRRGDEAARRRPATRW